MTEGALDNREGIPTTESISALKEVIKKQGNHIEHLRQLCDSQKESIKKLTSLNTHQHQMLVSLGLTTDNAFPDGNESTSLERQVTI
jgi:hypothetical protein